MVFKTKCESSILSTPGNIKKKKQHRKVLYKKRYFWTLFYNNIRLLFKNNFFTYLSLRRNFSYYTMYFSRLRKFSFSANTNMSYLIYCFYFVHFYLFFRRLRHFLKHYAALFLLNFLSKSLFSTFSSDEFLRIRTSRLCRYQHLWTYSNKYKDVYPLIYNTSSVWLNSYFLNQRLAIGEKRGLYKKNNIFLFFNNKLMFVMNFRLTTILDMYRYLIDFNKVMLDRKLFYKVFLYINRRYYLFKALNKKTVLHGKDRKRFIFDRLHLKRVFVTKYSFKRKKRRGFYNRRRGRFFRSKVRFKSKGRIMVPNVFNDQRVDFALNSRIRLNVKNVFLNFTSKVLLFSMPLFSSFFFFMIKFVLSTYLTFSNLTRREFELEAGTLVNQLNPLMWSTYKTAKFKKYLSNNVVYPFNMIDLLNEYEDPFAEKKIEKYFHPYPSSYMVGILKKSLNYLLGSGVILHLNLNFQKHVSDFERIILEDAYTRLFHYNFQFSTIFFLKEFLEFIMFSLKSKNFYLLFVYIQRIINNLIVWEHKRFFTFIFKVLSANFAYYFDVFGVKGIKILIKGKVGVGGNSRKRKMLLNLGKTSSSFMKARISTLSRLWNTRTGALGVRIWILYN